jgi:quinoprotein relay system zinc metallohydrolase 2
MKFRFLLILAAWLYSVSLSAGPVLPVDEVAPGLFVHWGAVAFSDQQNHGAIANIGFIVGERCVAIIDSGGNPAQGKALKQAVKRVTEKSICYVINTHVHPDHLYGNNAFKDSGAKFVGHANLPRAIALRSDFYLGKAKELLDIELSPQDLIPPDVTVKDTLELDLGGRKLLLTAHQTAHTDNDLSVYDNKTDTLWLADLLFTEHLPSLDGSLKGWLAEMAKLESRHFARVIPGHGALVTDWPKAMQPQKDYLTALLNESRAAVKKGVFLEDALKTVGYSFKNRWKLFDAFHPKNITKAYAELEWED